MGNNENISLELIVRTGDEQLFSNFVDQHKIDEPTRTEKHIETLIYSALRHKGEFDDGRFHYHSAKMRKLLANDRFRNYFTSTTNVTLLRDLVDKIRNAAENFAEHPNNQHEDVHAVDLLQIKEFADAINRNMNGDYQLKDSFKKCIQVSYWAVLAPANSKLAENINDYLTFLKPWEGFMDPLEVAKNVIKKFVWLIQDISSSENDYKNFCAAINKLTEFTDRSTVSRLVAEQYEGRGEGAELLRERVYYKLIESGVVDRYEPPEKHPAENLLKALQRYEDIAISDPEAVDKLRETIGEHGKEQISFKLAEWFDRGMIYHVKWIIESGSDLYDAAIARNLLTKSIEKAIHQKDWKKLDFAVEVLPENLIDKENPVIKTDILPAYQVIHTK